MRYFYHEYITIELLTRELDGLDLSLEERHHLADMLDSMLHHTVLDEILSNLNDDDKRLFLQRLHDNPEDTTLMNFLREKIEDIEEKIQKSSMELVRQLHQDIRFSKKFKKGG